MSNKTENRIQDFIETPPSAFFAKSSRAEYIDDGIHPGWRTGLWVYDLDSVLRCAACGINSSHFILFYLFFCFFFSSQQDGQSNESPYFQSPSPKHSQKQILSPAPFRSPSTGIKMKKSFLPEMTEEKLSPASSHSLAFDRRSHSGICSHHLECYLLFPLGIEGSKVIAKYCFFHELSKRTHTTFVKNTIYWSF